MKELKLRQAVQGPLRRRWTFWIMPSLSLVQQCALPKNWPFFRSRTSDNTAQCPTMETLFLGSMLMIIIVTNLAKEPVFSATLYLSQRHVARNPFSLANLVPKLSQDVCLGKGSNGSCTTLKCSFYLFSAASWEVYKALLKLVGVGTRSTPFWCHIHFK